MKKNYFLLGILLYLLQTAFSQIKITGKISSSDGMPLSGTSVSGLHTFKSVAADTPRTAFCLETQHYRYSPNQPFAPSTIKEAGKVYTSTTIHKFFTNTN